jgi:hypothetical protein
LWFAKTLADRFLQFSPFRGHYLQRSPSAHGVFGLVLDGKLLSYHYRLEKDLLPLMASKTGKKKPARKP